MNQARITDTEPNRAAWDEWYERQIDRRLADAKRDESRQTAPIAS